MKLLKSLVAVAALSPFAATAQDFNGASVGAQINFADAETSGAAALEGDDTLFGLRAYYDIDTGNGLIFGGGLQYDTADLDLEGVASVSNVLRLAARAGTVAGPAYVYGTAGWATASTDAGALDVGDSDGYFYGVGFSTYVADTVTVGGELLQHEFDSFDVDGLEADVLTFGVNVSLHF